MDDCDLSDEDLLMHHAIRRGGWSPWFETFATIDDKSKNRIGGMLLDGTPRPGKPLRANYLQQKIDEVVRWCKENHQPIRILVLKPRQKGSSTYTSGGLYHEINCAPRSAVIIGAKQAQAANLYGKIRTYSACDAFPWGTRRDCKAESAVFSHPGGGESTIKLMSAKEYDPGRSDTIQVLLATEVARWAEDGVANAADVLSGLLKCVSCADGTTVILETTAAGASGDYFERWMQARDFDQHKAAFEAGEYVTGDYIRVFAPWYEFEDSCHDLTDFQTDQLLKSLGKIARYNSPDFGDEQRIMADFNLTPGQMSWRRWAIDKECKKDARIFEQDYPSTWQTAFLTAGRKQFNSHGLRRIREMAERNPPKYGMLEWAGDTRDRATRRIVWRETSEDDGVIHLWDMPEIGHRFLIAVDTARGATQTVGMDPDAHSVGVLRAGWFDHLGLWHPPKLVARIMPGCRWDIDLVAEWIERMSAFWRGPQIVVEANNSGLALIEQLKHRSLNLYKRQVFDQLEKKMSAKLGWDTNNDTRYVLVERLTRALREYDTPGDGLDVCCLNAAKELAAFIRTDSGRAEAMQGHHDDDVLMLGIGMTCLEGAVTYTAPPPVHVPLPPDLQALERQMQRDGKRRDMTYA